MECNQRTASTAQDMICTTRCIAKAENFGSFEGQGNFLVYTFVEFDLQGNGNAKVCPMFLVLVHYRCNVAQLVLLMYDL